MSPPGGEREDLVAEADAEDRAVGSAAAATRTCSMSGAEILGIAGAVADQDAVGARPASSASRACQGARTTLGAAVEQRADDVVLRAGVDEQDRVSSPPA